ncbi:hypothetical protein KW850_10235 [Bacillus sp. sid0103]|uniref:hypothetical protein n=1 Tax=Bacillus sp. sid0103 TaxID=2856337 RepID=UPI001C490DAA|nr:hypothetical protein [Bacillus sp. sid0103]MBV7505633.1 hypothetical protein [Bacillus sp. sid0103]
MWTIALYLDSNFTMFEFETEEKAREAFKNMKGCKILSKIAYINDSRLVTN